jgi:hypothetical protein
MLSAAAHCDEEHAGRCEYTSCMPNAARYKDSTTTSDSCCGNTRRKLLKKLDVSFKQIHELFGLRMHLPAAPVFRTDKLAD